MRAGSIPTIINSPCRHLLAANSLRPNRFLGPLNLHGRHRVHQQAETRVGQAARRRAQAQGNRDDVSLSQQPPPLVSHASQGNAGGDDASPSLNEAR